MRINIIAIITITTILMGCSYSGINPYPEWPPLTVFSSEKCVSIAGNYKAISEPHQELEWLNKSLLEFLTEEVVKVNNTTVISISQEGKHNNHYLKITVRQDETIVYKFFLKEGKDFKCTNEGIEVFHDWHFVNINVGPASEKNYYTFSKATDGSLILKDSTHLIGVVFFFLPVKGEDVIWWRWLPIKKETP